MSKNPIHTIATLVFAGLLVVAIVFAWFQVGDINDLTERNETLVQQTQDQQSQIDGLKTENETLKEANSVMGVENQRLVTEVEELKIALKQAQETPAVPNVDMGIDMGMDINDLLEQAMNP